MANSQRRKGLEGEREVAAIWRSREWDVRNLEGQGDHLVSGDTGTARLFSLHVEVKRQERARPYEWITQAEAEAPPGAVPVVAFRRSRSKWYGLIGLEDLAKLLA